MSELKPMMLNSSMNQKAKLSKLAWSNSLSTTRKTSKIISSIEIKLLVRSLSFHLIKVWRERLCVEQCMETHKELESIPRELQNILFHSAPKLMTYNSMRFISQNKTSKTSSKKKSPTKWLVDKSHLKCYPMLTRMSLSNHSTRWCSNTMLSRQSSDLQLSKTWFILEHLVSKIHLEIAWRTLSTLSDMDNLFQRITYQTPLKSVSEWSLVTIKKLQERWLLKPALLIKMRCIMITLLSLASNSDKKSAATPRFGTQSLKNIELSSMKVDKDSIRSRSNAESLQDALLRISLSSFAVSSKRVDL